MKKRFLCVIFSLYAASVSAGENDFDSLIKSFNSIKSIKGRITQHIYSGASIEKFEGDYTSSTGGLFRIDYLSPERQTVISNSHGLFWYYPERELVFVKYRGRGDSDIELSLPGDPLRESFAGVNIVYEGIRFYGLLQYAHVYSFKNSKDSNSVYIWFEPGRRFVIKKYITDNTGREILKEIYHRHYRSGEVFIPSAIELFVLSKNGVVHTFTEYSDLVINSPVDNGVFDFRIKKNMTVRGFNE